MKRIAIALALAASVYAAPSYAQSDVRLSRNRNHVLVSKDVGDERWAITRNLDDGTVTGNVFFPDGGPPVFVDCEALSSSPAGVVLSCYGADDTGWTFIGEVPLPQSFFEPEAPPPPPPPSCTNASGSWRGGFSNSCGYSLAGTVVINQVGCDFSLSIPGQAEIVGKISGQSATFTLTSVPPCEGSATGTATVHDRFISGSYSGWSLCCPDLDGTFQGRR